MTSERWHRRSIRLPGYDYTSEGEYFLTIVTFNREPLFGDVTDGEITLNALGKIAVDEWIKSASIRYELELDDFVVMPNHLHGIVRIWHDVGAHGRAPLQPRGTTNPLVRSPRSIGSLIAGFKAAATKKINEHRNAPGLKVWQRNYYEHIIRDDSELARIRRYIIDNPANWQTDPENPASVGATATP